MMISGQGDIFFFSSRLLVGNAYSAGEKSMTLEPLTFIPHVQEMVEALLSAF
jgi:hypothetical protein